MISVLFAVSILACDGKATHEAKAEPGAPVIARATLSLDQLLQKHYDAQGGYDAIKGVQTLRLEGKSSGPDGDGTFTKTLKRPNLIRAEGTMGGKAWAKTFDGTAGVVTKNGETKTMEGDSLAHMKAMNIDDELVDWKARGHKVELVGLSTVRGAPAYKLKVELASGDTQWRWLDKKSALEVQRVVSGTHEGKAYTKTIRFDDYKKVEGSELIVNHTWSWDDGEKKGKTVFEKITVNPQVDDSYFKVEVPRS